MKILHSHRHAAVSALLVLAACSSNNDEVASRNQSVGSAQTSPGSSPARAEATTSNGFQVVFLGSAVNADGTSTWRYRVDELPCAQDLSNWVLEIFDCSIVSASPQPYELVNQDRNTGLTGVKWETRDGFATGTFEVTVSESARADTVRFAVKGPAVELGETTGPRCGDAAVPAIADAGKRPGGKGTKNRCGDASVPPPPDAGPPAIDSAPPAVDAPAVDAPAITDATSDPVCPPEHVCSEDTLCPAGQICLSNCCELASE